MKNGFYKSKNQKLKQKPQTINLLIFISSDFSLSTIICSDFYFVNNLFNIVKVTNCILLFHFLLSLYQRLRFFIILLGLFFYTDHGDSFQNEVYLKQTKKYLSNDERREIFCALLAKSIDGKLERNVTKEVSQQFSVPVLTVQRIWQRAKETASSGRVDVSNRKSGNCGRKRITLEPTRVTGVPLQKRTTLRSMSMAMNVSLTTLFRRKKEGFIRRHTNSIKPFITEDNKKGRLRFCISMLDRNTLSHEPKFVDMYNIVHIDEKWFYMTKKAEKYYLRRAVAYMSKQKLYWKSDVFSCYGSSKI